MTRILLRILLSTVAAVVALLVVEGALSLGFRKSLRQNALASLVTYSTPVSGSPTATPQSGSFMRAHPNPRIGIELIPDRVVHMIDREVRVSADGRRVRVGPAESKGALRIVILGDSVAFGIRLGDDETIASHLESILDAVRDPAGRDVVCETFAAPGWSGRNSTAALLDRIDEIRPDVVVFLPIDNDLCDTLGIGDGGGMAPQVDVLAPQPLLRAGYETVFARVVHLANAWRAGELVAPITSDELGKILLNHGTTPASRSRYDAECAAIFKLDRALRSRGARLYAQFYLEEATDPVFAKVMRQRLRSAVDPNRRIAEIGGFETEDPSFTLENDMHPSSRGARALAAMIARRLIDDGVVAMRDGAELEEVDPELVPHLAPQLDDAALDEAVAAIRATIASGASSRLVPETGRGCVQVFGGLNPDATMGPDFVAGLRRDGDHLRIVVAPLEPPPPLPVELTVSIDDRLLGVVVVPPDATDPVAVSFAVGDTGAVFEVRLVASDWWTRFGANKRLLASCRLIELASE